MCADGTRNDQTITVPQRSGRATDLAHTLPISAVFAPIVRFAGRESRSAANIGNDLPLAGVPMSWVATPRGSRAQLVFSS